MPPRLVHGGQDGLRARAVRPVDAVQLALLLGQLGRGLPLLFMILWLIIRDYIIVHYYTLYPTISYDSILHNMIIAYHIIDRITMTYGVTLPYIPYVAFSCHRSCRALASAASARASAARASVSRVACGLIIQKTIANNNQ